MVSRRKEKSDQKRVVNSVFDLIEQGAADDLAEVAENTDIAYLLEFEEDAEEYIKNQGKYMGISTGYQAVDNRMGSFIPGELMTIGGDTGHGKSLFAMNIAQNVYKETMNPVLFVTLELTHAQSVVRFHNLAENNDYAGIMVQRKPAVSYRDIDVIMQKAKDEGACLVVIDHLHFFPRGQDNQTAEVSRIMKHFKECAVQHDLPVILLSHVTPRRDYGQDGEVKKVHKPGLHNFKNSSSIEQDSDMVACVYREPETPNRMEFYMLKNRSRPNDPEPVYFEQKDWKLIEVTKEKDKWADSEKKESSSKKLSSQKMQF